MYLPGRTTLGQVFYFSWIPLRGSKNFLVLVFVENRECSFEYESRDAGRFLNAVAL